MIARRGLAAKWTAVNPILRNGEWGYETDTQQIKLGDGTTPWVALSYFTTGSATVLPVGSVFITTPESANPGTILGYGTWALLEL